MKRKKLLVVCPYPEGVAPSQRLKYEQYFDHLRRNGYDIDVRPFMTGRFWKIVYKKGYFAEKIFWTLVGYLNRILLLFRLKSYDGMYIHLNVIPFGSPLMEFLYSKLLPNYVYDIDDLFYLGRTNKVNRIVGYFRSPAKYAYLMKHARHIIVCTPFLENHARQFNSNITDISSTINTDTYLPLSRSEPSPVTIIGWSGSYSTCRYLHLLDDVLREVAAVRNIKVHVLGTDNFQIEGVEVVAQNWSSDLEIPFIQNFDIGLYPLPTDDEFVYGKSGLKALQYMALGVPTVATRIGTIHRIIRDGENGYLALSAEEWKEKLLALIDDPGLGRRMGREARKTVLDSYSIHANKDTYLDIVSKIVPL